MVGKGKKNRLLTDALREVKNTRSRFFSILILSALAVAFLSGIKITAPDMQYTADCYYDRLNVMDGSMEKLADYCKWESDYSRSEIMKLLGCVKTIVFVDDFKIRQIAVNHGWEEEKNHNRIELVYDREKGVDKL